MFGRRRVWNLIETKVLLQVILVVLVLTCTALAADWPQYLGPDRNSTSPEKGFRDPSSLENLDSICY